MACVKEEGDDEMITPGEAEERAGHASNKNWKQSLYTWYQVGGMASQPWA